MEKIFEIITTSGPQGGFVGLVLLIYYYVRKQESGVRTEINGSLQRLQTEAEALRDTIDELEKEVDTERDLRRKAEDREAVQRRRADLLEAELRNRDQHG